MNKLVSMEDIIPLIKEQIENDGEVTFTPKGISMMPMLRHNRDTVTLGKPVFPLKKYQVVLYIRDNGVYVLHRVIRVKKNEYVMRGDNHFVNEPGIRQEQVVAVLKGFTRKNKNYECKSVLYRLYYRIWVNTAGLRKILKTMMRAAGAVKRKILRIFR